MKMWKSIVANFETCNSTRCQVERTWKCENYTFAMNMILRWHQALLIKFHLIACRRYFENAHNNNQWIQRTLLTKETEKPQHCRSFIRPQYSQGELDRITANTLNIIVHIVCVCVCSLRNARDMDRYDKTLEEMWRKKRYSIKSHPISLSYLGQ